MSRFVVAAITQIVLLGWLPTALGANYFWNKTNGGAFGVAANWGPLAGGPGDGDDTVNFELGQSTNERYAVNGVSGENNRLLVHHDALTLILSDDYSLLSFGINPPSMVVGVANGEVGDVIIAGSPLGGISSLLDTERVIIGQSAGSTGVVRASNLRWESGVIVVGDSGEGTLEIVGGSEVTGPGLIGLDLNSTGTVTVSGNGSTWDNGPIGGLNVGDEGDGTLTISNGGRVSSFVATIGSLSSSTGTATVTGAGSSWSSDNEMIVGYVGTGSLTIEAGGRVENDLGGYVGQLAGSHGTVTVRGNGSTWTNNQVFVVGYFGDGTLMITNGGDVSNDQGWIGYDATASGEVTVSGTGSTWTNSESLEVGRDGAATLTIQDGGSVSNTLGSIAENDGSTGTVMITGAGSTWTNSNNLSVGNAGEGSLTIADGGNVSNLRGYIGLVAGSNGTVRVTGDDSTWTSTSGIAVGLGGVATLIVEAGGKVSNDEVDIASGAGSTGTVMVRGAGSEWENSSYLVVGRIGTGTLTIDDGGNVSNDNGAVGLAATGVGTVVVRGAGSNWTNVGTLEVGDFGTGMMTIEDGGEVVNFTDGGIGVVADSTGTVTVRGAGSRWANGDFLRVGDEGEGMLRILSGGTVTNGDGRVGAGPGSNGEVIVRGGGSTWTNFDTLNVGSIGTGTLSIETGGHVSNTNASIGSTSASDGTVTVTGAGSRWVNSGELRVGSSGTGRLTIQAGGSVSSANGILASTGTSTGRVTVTGNGSNWTLSGQLSIAGHAASGTNGGTAFLNIQPGSRVDVAQDTVIFPDGLLTLEGGTLATTAINFEGGGQFNWTSGTLHVGVYEGNLTNPPGGTLAPGRSAGSTTILGDYTQQAGGTLEIEIGGTATATEFDFVDVTGTAILGGELQLALINNFVPGPTDEFVVLNAGNLVSFFSNVGNSQRLETVDGLASFAVHYGPTSAFDADQIVLTDFLSLFPGDYNQNGTVDAADYSLWRDRFGSPTSLPNDDTPGVADDDYTRWRANFGQTIGGNAGGASVTLANSAIPEPASLALLSAGIVGGFSRTLSNRRP